MSMFSVALAVLLIFVVGFFTGAALLVIVAINRIEHEGRFDAGPVSIIGYLEHRDDRWN